MLALGCFDMFITLPIQVIALFISAMDSAPFRFYNGWTYIHSDWGPNLEPQSLWSTSKWTVFIVHWDEWLYPFFALVFFTLFGLTPENRKGYRRFFRVLCRPFGTKHVVITDEVLLEVVFKSGKGADASYTSKSFSATVWVISIFSALQYIWKEVHRSDADVMSWVIIRNTFVRVQWSIAMVKWWSDI